MTMPSYWIEGHSINVRGARVYKNDNLAASAVMRMFHIRSQNPNDEVFLYRGATELSATFDSLVGVARYHPDGRTKEWIKK